MAGSNQKRNAYSVLGLHKGVSDEEIKQAYVALVKKYDPELHTDRFMVVQKAFDSLRDPLRRAREDILTFNFIRGEYMFSKEERVDVPDAKLSQAIQMLEQKQETEPDNAANAPKLIQGYLIRSCKNVQKKLLKEAIDDWVRVLQIDPTNQRAKNNMLVAFIRLGYSYANHALYDESIEVWEKAAQMDPDNHLIIHNLALACEFSGRMDKARKYWDETVRRWKVMIDQNPDDEYMKNCVIEAIKHQNEWSDAGNAPATNGGTAHAKADAPAASPGTAPAPTRPRGGDELEQCREIIKLRPDDFDANLRLGQLLCEQKRWTEAVPHLSELHRKFPRNTEVINLLGWSQLNNQETDMAISTWERGLKLDPKNHTIRESIVKARMLMGRALRDKGLFINSLVQFKALMRYLPESDEVHYELGQTYQKKGDFRSAYLEYQNVLKINPKHKLARSALSELKMRRA